MEHSIALVDDHHLMRSGLATMINGLGGYRVTIEAGHGRELIHALMGKKAPDIAIVDLNMPVMDGYATLEWLRANGPGIRTLALTFDATDEALIRAVRSGARGFLLKNIRPPVLRTALDSLIETGFFYSDGAQETIQLNPHQPSSQERKREEILKQMTPREMEFLLHVCSDSEPTYEDIAQEMGVHRRTLDGFRIGLFEKFHIRSKTGLVLFAMRWGFIK